MRTPRFDLGGYRPGLKGHAWSLPGLALLLVLWCWPAAASALARAASLPEASTLPVAEPSDVLEAQAAWAQQRERLLDVLARDTARALLDLQADSTRTINGAAPPVALPEGKAPDRGAPTDRSAARLRLRGLYGMEPRFTVLLEVDGVMKLYRPGASLPLNGEGAEHEFRLLRVQDRCVVLRWGAAKPRTACYHNTPAVPVPTSDPSWLEGLQAPLPDFARQ